MEADATRDCTIEVLANRLHWAKIAEQEANERRVEIEAEIAARVPGNDEGTTHSLTDKWDIVVTRKLTRKINEDVWNTIKSSVPEGLEPVKTKLELDTKKYKAIEAANPALYAMVSRAVTITPAKTSVSLRQLGEAA